MLNILADSLLLATRLTPANRAFGDERDEFPLPEQPKNTRRRFWVGLMGIHL